MDIPSKLYLIKRNLKDEDWKAISIFKQRAEDFIEIRKDIGPKIISAKATGLECGGFKGETNIPKNKDLKLFYLSFRFFYLEKEASNFLKIRNTISKVAIDARVKSYLKSLKDQWKIALSRTHSSEFFHKEINDFLV